MITSVRVTARPHNQGTTMPRATAGPATMATVTKLLGGVHHRGRLVGRTGRVARRQGLGPGEHGFHETSGSAEAHEAEPYRTVSADRALELHPTGPRPRTDRGGRGGSEGREELDQAGRRPPDPWVKMPRWLESGSPRTGSRG